ncbi:hypothetical protein F5Y19DRAFT_469302 [Xylariaceae sp. FL1651]|nr:hypothetical protein F5Y19DRAFT_469302 [Xylariaceae sp. FL1651]
MAISSLKSHSASDPTALLTTNLLGLLSRPALPPAAPAPDAGHSSTRHATPAVPDPKSLSNLKVGDLASKFERTSFTTTVNTLLLGCRFVVEGSKAREGVRHSRLLVRKRGR